MHYEHFIFDVDGTLIDNETAVLQAWKDTLLELQGRTYRTQELTFVLGIPGEDTLARLGIRDTGAAFDVWKKYFARHASSVRLFDGIPDTLSALKDRGARLGVVTSRTRAEFTEDETLRPLTGWFAATVCITDSPRPKPFVDPILVYLEQTGAQPERVLFIGDSAYDSQCARNAGVDFAWAAWGTCSPQDIPALYRFDTPEDILKNL